LNIFLSFEQNTQDVGQHRSNIGYHSWNRKNNWTKPVVFSVFTLYIVYIFNWRKRCYRK